MLPVEALDCSINGFLRRSPIRHRVELRRFARSSGPTPVHHVAVVTTISVQRQLVVCEESPALGICMHISN